MSKNFVLEGWLIKSPPSTRIWKSLCKHSILKQKWQRRWFRLRQSDEVPGQYFLDYYASRSCRRLKGSINLDYCDKVQAGLYMERRNKILSPKHRGSVFTIQTQSRTYHLEAETELEMAKWVDAICKLCNFEATEERVVQLPTPTSSADQNNSGAASNQERKKRSQKNGSTNAARTSCTGPYIPISECITGFRSRTQRAFSFDPKDICSSFITTNRSSNRNSSPTRVNDIALSDLESIDSGDEDDLNEAMRAHLETSLSKLSVNASKDEDIVQSPPVPSRPPKTLGKKKDKTRKPKESHYVDASESTWICVPLPRSTSPLSSLQLSPQTVSTDDEDDVIYSNSTQYFNVSPTPPPVNRALKPRFDRSGGTSAPGSAASSAPSTSRCPPTGEEIKDDKTIQYLDLDLPASQPGTSGCSGTTKPIIHGSASRNEDYKTVDFVKTEAFKVTRQSAEAIRHLQ